MRTTLLAAALLSCWAGPVLSGRAADLSGKAGDVTVDQAWARASAGSAPNGAAYVTLKGGAQPDKLTGVSTPVANSAEVHESMTEGGVMRMRPAGAVDIPAGKTVTFAPGGYHIMLMGLHDPLKAGQPFPLTLTFEHAQPVTVNVEVRPIGAAAARAGGTQTDQKDHGGHDHMQMQ